MKLILDGIWLGFVLSLMTGPIFFALIETSIKRGFKAGVILASGVWFSDLIYILIVFVGLSFIKDLPNFNFYVGIIGGLLLCLFGLFSLLTKPDLDKMTQPSRKTYFGEFFKGMAINIFNPFVILLWIGVVGNLTKDELNIKNSIIFLSSMLLCVALSDLVKIYLAEKIREKITEKYMRIFNIVIGVSLMLFGFVLIYRVL